MPYGKRGRGSAVSPDKAKQILKDDEVGAVRSPTSRRGSSGPAPAGLPRSPRPATPRAERPPIGDAAARLHAPDRPA